MTSSGTNEVPLAASEEKGEGGDDRQNAQGRDQTLAGPTDS